MSDGIDTVDTEEIHEKPMDPTAMEATPEQSKAYKKILEKKGVLPPPKVYETPPDIQQQRRLNDWKAAQPEPINQEPVTSTLPTEELVTTK